MIIERMKETRPGETICLSYEECEEVLRTIDDQQERIAIMSEGGWRDVKTDPPKEYCDCIVVANGQSELAHCGFDRFGVLHFDTPDVYESEKINGVTHWMPIPEPPKEGEQG